MRRMRKTFLLVCMLVAVFFAPLVYAHWKYPPTNDADLRQADAALVFGALVRDGTISPLHAERLNAAIDLYDRHLVPVIVVSNTHDAASTMATYLEDNGIPRSAIEIDGHAEQTPDTCRKERARNAPRSVILISQGFHIPRLSLQCHWEGVSGQSLAAESYRAASPDQLPRWRVIQIRSLRHAREASLLWTALLGLYDDL